MITAMFVLAVLFLSALLLGFVLLITNEDEAAELCGWAWTVISVALSVLAIIQAARAWN